MFKIQFSFQPGLNVNQILAFEMAGQIWSHFLQDDITVDIHVSITDQLPDFVLGGAIPNYQSVDLKTVQLALQGDITSENDGSAVDALGLDGILLGTLGNGKYEGDTVTITQSQAAALGLEIAGNQREVDGYIVLNSLNRSPFQWNYDFARKEPPESNSLDILSVALHEIGHILGFTSGIDAPIQRTVSEQLAQTTILDLFRYSERSRLSGSNELTRGAAAYFSIDGGSTNLAPLATGILPLGDYSQGFQASHWGSHQVKVKGITVAADTAPIIQFINAMTQLASPVDSENWVDSVEQLLAYANGGTIDTNIQVILGDQGDNLGILDPTLAPKERSSISALDLIAFDVIGYDLKEGSALDLDYSSLLSDAKQAVSQSLGLESEDLEKAIEKNANLWGRDRLGEVLSAINRSEVYERRRLRQRVTASASFWQEEEIAPNRLNIESNGGGNVAHLSIESDGTWVTQVNASPRSPLRLSTQDAQGSDFNDLIISPNNKVVDKAGHNIIYRGQKGGEIETGLGNDIIYSNGGNTTIRDDGGNNVILLQGLPVSILETAIHQVTTGAGDDTIEFSANTANIQSGFGNDTIYGRNSSLALFGQSSFMVTAMGGDNTIKLAGNAYQVLLVATGDGDDHLDLVGQSGTIQLGEGNNQLLLDIATYSDVRVGKGNSVLHIKNSAITIHYGNNLFLDDGNHQVSVEGASIQLTADQGDKWINLEPSNPLTLYLHDLQIAGGNNNIRLGQADVGRSKVVTGAGSDVINARAGHVQLTTGEGQDLIVLGDRDAVGFKRFGLLDYLQVTDFSTEDRILLHGNRQDYSVGNTLLNENYLYYQGEFVAKFEGGIAFDLNSDRVLFTDDLEAGTSQLPEDLANRLNRIQSDQMIAPVEAIAPPQREEILYDAQTQFLENEAVTYQIVSGADADLFEIDSQTGHLSFKDAVDGENSQDANQDGVYEVRVQAAQGGGQTEQVIDSQLLFIRPEQLPDPAPDRNVITGNDLDNNLSGTSSSEVIHGRSGKDVIQGDAGNDQLFGDAGNDAIFGGEGNDILSGSNSIRRGAQEIDHYVEGGLGQDLFVLGDVTGSYYATAEGSDFIQIADFEAGVDQVSLFGSEADYRLETEDGSSWLYYLDDAIAVFDQRPDLSWDDLVGDRRIIFDPTQPLSDLTSSEPVPSDTPEPDGTLAFDNILNGTPQTDTLNGEDGQDILRGGQNHDYLIGGVGNDTLFGQDGVDTLHGSSPTQPGTQEKDILFGGKGADLFVLGDEQSVYYAQHQHQDEALIKDFAVDQDRIQLSGSAQDYRLQTAGAHLAITQNGDRIALLSNVQTLSLDSSTFEFV